MLKVNAYLLPESGSDFRVMSEGVDWLFKTVQAGYPLGGTWMQVSSNGVPGLCIHLKPNDFDLTIQSAVRAMLLCKIFCSGLSGVRCHLEIVLRVQGVNSSGIPVNSTLFKPCTNKQSLFDDLCNTAHGRCLLAWP